MVNKRLVGYVRLSRRGNAVKVDLSLEDFLLARRYLARDGKQYVSLVINLSALREVMDGKREVTSVSQLYD